MVAFGTGIALHSSDAGLRQTAAPTWTEEEFRGWREWLMAMLRHKIGTASLRLAETVHRM